MVGEKVKGEIDILKERVGDLYSEYHRERDIQREKKKNGQEKAKRDR